MFLLNCDTCDRGYHMQCLQPPAGDKPKSAWRCSFCLDHHETTNISIEEESYTERRGKKKSSLKNQKYVVTLAFFFFLNCLTEKLIINTIGFLRIVYLVHNNKYCSIFL
jgi:hypothetical protein